MKNYEKTSPLSVQQAKINWLVLPQNTSFKNKYFCRQSYYHIYVCLYIQIYVCVYIVYMYICVYVYVYV